MRLDELRRKFEDAGHRVSVRDDVDARAAAWFTGYKVSTLANRRSKGKEPCYIDHPSGVRYPIACLVEWLESMVRNRAA